MRLQILIDNRPDSAEKLFSEHGLCIYMEIGDKRFLVDTGLTGRAMDNAAALGVDVSCVDYLILSHGHKDHTGGLGRFAECNRDARIVGSRMILDCDYTSDSRGYRHSLNPDRCMIEENAARFCWVGRDGLFAVSCNDNIMVAAGACNAGGAPRPRGNRLLRVNGDPYNGEDELVITAVEDGRLTVVSPCSHSGLGNIIKCAEERTGLRCSTFVGGLHLIDGEGDMDGMAVGCDIGKIYTGHCTGMEALERLRAMAGVEVFRTGDVIYC